MRLLHSAYGINNFIKIPVAKTHELLASAKEQEMEAFAWDLWTGQYPFMVMGYIEHETFENYKSRVLTNRPKKTLLTAEEIVDDISRVINIYESKKAGEK